MENIIMDEKVLDKGKTNTCNQTEPNVTEVETVQKCGLFSFWVISEPLTDLSRANSGNMSATDERQGHFSAGS